MAFKPFALNLWVQADKSRWKDWEMDKILERDAEMQRLESYGDWCEALHDRAERYPLVVTSEGLEGSELLPVVLDVVRPELQDATDNKRVASILLRVEGQLVTRNPILTSVGIVWAMPRRQEAPMSVPPPVENIKNGYKCEDCKRFSHSDGQAWLNEVTHPFHGEGQSKRMWPDVISMIGQGVDVQMPNNPIDWGTCLEHNRLVERDFPGCECFSKRVQWVSTK